MSKTLWHRIRIIDFFPHYLGAWNRLDFNKKKSWEEWTWKTFQIGRSCWSWLFIISQWWAHRYNHAEESRILQGYCIPYKDTVFHRSTEENGVLIVARENVLDAADMFIQDREDSLHFSRRWTKHAVNLDAFVATSIEGNCPRSWRYRTHWRPIWGTANYRAGQQ